MAEYKSITATVDRPQMTIFSALADLNTLFAAVPAEHRENIEIEGDVVKITVSGFTISFRQTEKVPFTLVSFQDVEAPFHFKLSVHMDPAESPLQTSLWMEADADLNFMMKTLIGPRIKEALDKIVTSIASGEIHA